MRCGSCAGRSNRTVVNEQREGRSYVVEPEGFFPPEDIARRKNDNERYKQGNNWINYLRKNIKGRKLNIMY